MKPSDDPAFEAYLRGDSELSRRYRDTAEESPPPALDTAILAHARRAARPRRPRWAPQLAMAATVVLGVAILFAVQRQEPAPIGANSAPAPASAESVRQAPSGAAAPATRNAAPRARPQPSQPPKIQRYQEFSSGAAPATADAKEPDFKMPEPKMKAPAPVPAREEWLARIRQLLEQGRREAAIAELQAHRQQYPDQPLPPDLKVLLQPE